MSQVYDVMADANDNPGVPQFLFRDLTQWPRFEGSDRLVVTERLPTGTVLTHYIKTGGFLTVTVVSREAAPVATPSDWGPTVVRTRVTVRGIPFQYETNLGTEEDPTRIAEAGRRLLEATAAAVIKIGLGSQPEQAVVVTEETFREGAVVASRRLLVTWDLNVMEIAPCQKIESPSSSSTPPVATPSPAQ